MIEEAIKKIQVKGKYLKDTGLQSGKLVQYFYCQLEGDVLSFWNGNTSFVVNFTMYVDGEEDGNFVGSIPKMLEYMKKFKGQTTVEAYDFIRITSDAKSASIAKIINHPNSDAILRLKELISHINFEPIISETTTFSSSRFEGAFQTFGRDFSEAISLLELCRSGAYKLDFTGDDCSFTSTSGIESATAVMPLLQYFGEPATLEYSGPVHNFFDNDELINFYVKDDFPLLIVSANKKILKAPFTGGN